MESKIIFDRKNLLIIFGLIFVVVGGMAFFSWKPVENIEQTTVEEGGVTDLKIEDLVVGEGVEAKEGNSVTVHYTGTLTDGTKFDSSLDRGDPFTFNLGAGDVIKGWDQGVAGMKVGGKRRLTIPAELGYGESGSGSAIPPNATLIFEVALLDVE